MDAKELLSKIATPGDAAAAGIGFAAGLPLDYFLLHMGVPPGIVSGYCAVGAYSLKKSADAFLESRKKRKEARHQELSVEKERDTARKELEERYEGLYVYLKEENRLELLELLKKRRKQWEHKILSDQAFDASLKQIIEKYEEATMV